MSIKLSPLPAKKMLSVYDVEKTYLENLQSGPFFSGYVPARDCPKQSEWKEFLGHPIISPIGIPAGPLLNAKWIAFAAKLGFDVLTYKTIRSYSHPSHPLPNVVFVETDGELTSERKGKAVKKRNAPPSAFSDLAITNSFGNPSRSPAYLQEDIEQAREVLNEGQVLIVSVFGTGSGEKPLIDDFVRTALLAKEGGAQIIEANFSCPNLGTDKNLFEQADLSEKIASAIAKAISPTPLIIKIGIPKNPEELPTIVQGLAKAGVHAIAGINTIPMKVVDEKGNPALGKERVTSGICGSPIRSAALGFVQSVRAIIQKEKLDLQLLGCGGITEAEHFNQFLNDADIAMSATGMMWDPYLAMRWHQGDSDETKI